MARTTGSILFLTFFLCISVFSFQLSRNALWTQKSPLRPSDLTARADFLGRSVNFAVREVTELIRSRINDLSFPEDSIPTTSVLFPDWEVLVTVSPETQLPPGLNHKYSCLFQNNAASPATFTGRLPFTNQTLFKCPMPNNVRRLRRFLQPVLTTSPQKKRSPSSPTPELLWWTFLVYEAISTEDDVILFAKGVNNHPKSPDKLRCVFGEPEQKTAVRTAVTSSSQEVFRCRHPNVSAAAEHTRGIKISLEILEKDQNKVVPSVAYYTPRTIKSKQDQKSVLCASTMVFNVAKFVKEWIKYHSAIGVDKFFLYDNGSEDDLQRVVKELREEGFTVETIHWIWPKTQEAGFSHSVLHAKDSCTWMIFTDVDEFLFNLSWQNSSRPSEQMIKSLIPRGPRVGQVSIQCHEFGPSGQKSHPEEGVTQGYTCRMQNPQRHKSMVLLDAVDCSLKNVIHHFELRRGFEWRHLGAKDVVVNHYKYQAWSEFRAKFRRRVSAFVVDWTERARPNSNDRTPGLGFKPVEPKGWARKFCEVGDKRLKILTQRWFGTGTANGHRMAWQRQ